MTRVSGSDPSERLVLDRARARAVDRRAIEEFGIPGIVLMENAARGLRDVALSMLQGIDEPRVLIACGRGNNGGDGYALARLLDEAGASVAIVALGACRAGTDAATNQAICQAMELPIQGVPPVPALEGMHLLVDALFGTGLDRPLTGAAAELVHRLNDSSAPILAADVPSGLDCDSGLPVSGGGPTGPCIKATRTVTFVALKSGFLNAEAYSYTGDVSVASIGVPHALLVPSLTSTVSPSAR